MASVFCSSPQSQLPKAFGIARLNATFDSNTVACSANTTILSCIPTSAAKGGITDEDYDYFRQYKDVIIIDEAHHFRNAGSNRGQLLTELAKEKKLYLLTATPINNSLEDISNLINYFGQPSNHFARIGVHDFRKHFRDIEKRFEDEHAEIAEKVDDEDLLRQDPVLKQVLIQRSREYIKHAEKESGG